MAKKLLILCCALIALALGLWIWHGSNIYTKDKVKVVVVTKNPDFGTEEERIEWKDEFRVGLDVIGPIIGVCAVGAGLCLFYLYRAKK
jgi:hypothetical protein